MSAQRAYDVVAPISRMTAFHSARKRERKQLLDFFDQLALNPFTESEWSVTDATGRPNFQSSVGRFLVTWWADHATKEIRIVKLARLE